jgi:hypothetical protein
VGPRATRPLRATPAEPLLEPQLKKIGAESQKKKNSLQQAPCLSTYFSWAPKCSPPPPFPHGRRERPPTLPLSSWLVPCPHRFLRRRRCRLGTRPRPPASRPAGARAPPRSRVTPNQRSGSPLTIFGDGAVESKFALTRVAPDRSLSSPASLLPCSTRARTPMCAAYRSLTPPSLVRVRADPPPDGHIRRLAWT